MLAWRVRPSVRCRYAVHIRVLRSTSRRLGRIRNRRAAAGSGRNSASEAPGSGSGMRGQEPRVSALAATTDLPLDSPFFARGKGDTSPCRLSLESKNRFFPRTGKKWFLNKRRLPALSDWIISNKKPPRVFTTRGVKFDSIIEAACTEAGKAPGLPPAPGARNRPSWPAPPAPFPSWPRPLRSDSRSDCVRPPGRVCG